MTDTRQQERKRKKKKSKQMQSKNLPKTVGWYPETALCTEEHKLQTQAAFRHRAPLLSQVHNPELRVQTGRNCKRLMRFGVKFFSPQPALRLPPHTLQQRGAAEFVPGAAPLMSATTWAPGSGDALSSGAFPRQRRQSGGSSAPTWTPGASTPTSLVFLYFLHWTVPCRTTWYL